MSSINFSALAAIPKHFQQMRTTKLEGIKLVGVGETVQTPDGGTQQVIYREGDPEFEAYLAEAQEITLPRNFMSFGVGKDGTTGTQMARQISSTFDQYYAGTADEKTLEGVMSDIVENLRSSYVEKGFDPDEFMPKLLRDVYDIARMDNIHGAGDQSWRDSRE